MSNPQRAEHRFFHFDSSLCNTASSFLGVAFEESEAGAGVEDEVGGADSTIFSRGSMMDCLAFSNSSGERTWNVLSPWYFFWLDSLMLAFSNSAMSAAVYSFFATIVQDEQKNSTYEVISLNEWAMR